MRCLILIFSVLAAPSALACDWFGSGGAAHRYDEGYSGPMLAVGCAFYDGKWELSLNGFGEQSLYDDRLKVDPYLALIGQRVWTWRQDKFLRPFLAAGVMLKKQDTCHDTFITRPNGKVRRVFDPDCNRLTPEWWAADFAGGLGFGEHVRAGLHHASNFGATIQNGGQDYWRLDWLTRF
jgi:hypothetical protein